MPINLEKLKERKNVCNLLKAKLIESLDIPYEAEDIHDDISLVGAGLGLDSLDILEIVLCVESNFGIKMPEKSAEIMRSFNTLVDFIISEKGGENVIS